MRTTKRGECHRGQYPYGVSTCLACRGRGVLDQVTKCEACDAIGYFGITLKQELPDRTCELFASAWHVFRARAAIDWKAYRDNLGYQADSFDRAQKIMLEHNSD